MIVAQTLDSALQDFPLRRSRPFVIALGGEKIPQGGDGAQAQIMVPAETLAYVPNHPFEQRPRAFRLPGLPIRECNLKHQSKRL